MKPDATPGESPAETPPAPPAENTGAIPGASLAGTPGSAPSEVEGFRSGIVAVVGRANVGKSSLVNALLGEKVSIVSHVPQTTRHMIRGILNDPRGQLVLLDTPGIHRSSNDMGRLMNRTARRSAEGVDVAMLVVDGTARPEIEDEGWMRRLLREHGAQKCLVVVNKRDQGVAYDATYRTMWTRVAAELSLPADSAWLSVSALTGEGMKELSDELFLRLPVHPALFPDNVLSDFPRKLHIADVIREKLVLRLHDELPHRVAVWVEELQEEPGPDWKVRAVIYIERESQKGIIIGFKGRLLRAVKRGSEAELKAAYERTVHVDVIAPSTAPTTADETVAVPMRKAQLSDLD